MLPWARALVVEARRLGVRPMVLYEDEEAYWRCVETLPAGDIGKVGSAEWGALEAADGYVFLWGPEDRARLAGLPPETRAALQSYNEEWYRRAEKNRLRACRVELGRATAPMADRYGVDLSAWRSELVRASLVDPARFQADAKRLAPKLKGGKTLTVTHANGTSLQLKLAARAPVVDDAVVDEADVRGGSNVTTVPGASVLVAVDERAAEGRFVANRRSYLTAGPVEGGHWTFHEGKLTQFGYDAGEEHFSAPFEKAPAGKERPAFFSFGLNPELRFSPNLEDQERGVVTLGIGGNQSYGGKSRVPFQSWLVLHGAHVEIDGKPVAADGEIL